MIQSPDFSLTPLLDARTSALFLDFDGTLVDLAPQPDAIVLPEGLIPLLAALRDHLGGALAVVSGRPILAIDEFLQPLDLPVAGVHGAERRTADGRLLLQPSPPLEAVEHAAMMLHRQYPDLMVETKRGALALHYRQAPHLETLCRETLQAAVDQSTGVTLLHGKMVLEAKSALAHKGLAVAAFLREAPFAGRKPLFIGDDTTDEAGFSVAQMHGGTGLKVGPGLTVASHRISGPAELYRALQAWLPQR
jgi:trehalose 6-phosphate phosphatase